MWRQRVVNHNIIPIIELVEREKKTDRSTIGFGGHGALVCRSMFFFVLFGMCLVRDTQNIRRVIVEAIRVLDRAPHHQSPCSTIICNNNSQQQKQFPL